MEKTQKNLEKEGLKKKGFKGTPKKSIKCDKEIVNICEESLRKNNLDQTSSK